MAVYFYVYIFNQPRPDTNA